MVFSEQVLWMVPPTVLYIYLPVSGDSLVQIVLVSIGTGLFAWLLNRHLHLFPSLSSTGCSTFWHHWTIAFSYVCNCVLNWSPNICGSLFCSLLKFSAASGAFFQTKHVLWKVSPTIVCFMSPNVSWKVLRMFFNWSLSFCSPLLHMESSISCGQCIIAELAYSKKTIQPIHLHSKINHGILWTYFRSQILGSIWFPSLDGQIDVDFWTKINVVYRCLVTCDTWKGFGDKSGAEVNKCARSVGWNWRNSPQQSL